MKVYSTFIMSKKIENTRRDYQNRAIIRNNPTFISAYSLNEQRDIENANNRVQIFLRGGRVRSFDEFLKWRAEDFQSSSGKENIEKLIENSLSEEQLSLLFAFNSFGKEIGVEKEGEGYNITSIRDADPSQSYKWLWTNDKDGRRFLLRIGEGSLFNLDLTYEDDETIRQIARVYVGELPNYMDNLAKSFNTRDTTYIP